MPQVWGMFRDKNALLSCVRECAPNSQVSVFLPNAPPAADRVLLLGPLVRLVSPYPFLDMPRHLRRLGVDSGTASRYTEGLARGWCLVCIDGLPGRISWSRHALCLASILP